MENSNFDWKEYRLSFSGIAKEVLQSLSLEEKVSLMSGAMSKAKVREAIQRKSKTHYNEEPYRAGGISKKNIPPLYFVDGTRGVVCGRGKATCFPVAVMRGACFDKELEEKVGEVIAREVRIAGGNLFGGVCVNLPYHPGWGRAQEAYGEDSCLLGEMGAALVRGIQKNGVIACVKHFAFNSMENSRFDVDITCSKRTEQEVFLPHFRKCIEAGAGAVMSAYNSYRGFMCGHNEYLLKQVLKIDWDFDGFVLSDFTWGVKDTVAAANAGQDMEMPNTLFYGENLLEAVRQGNVSETVIDEAAYRIIRTLLAHQNYIEAKEQEDSKKNASVKEYEIRKSNMDIKNNKSSKKYKDYIERGIYLDHKALALTCARKGITMIRNEHDRLPFQKRLVKNIVVLGALAEQENIGDKGSSQVYPPHVVTILKGIADAAVGTEIVYYGGDSLTHCKRLAKDADAVIIVAGNDYHDEGEFVAIDDDTDLSTHLGGDREKGLGVQSRDLRIIQAVQTIRTDAVVVLVGGSMITMKEWHEKTGAILLAYYPGMEGGTALGEVLFGKVNPGGKLPFVIPETADDLPTIVWNTKQQFYEYYHGYTLLDKEKKKPLYPFGFGLSYTTFVLGEPEIKTDGKRLYAAIDIKNTGKISGDEVIQMYVGTDNSKVDRPVKQLRAFERVSLRAGEAKRVTLQCKLSDLEYYDEDNGCFVFEKTEYQVYVGTSSDEKDLHCCSHVISNN